MRNLVINRIPLVLFRRIKYGIKNWYAKVYLWELRNTYKSRFTYGDNVQIPSSCHILSDESTARIDIGKNFSAREYLRLLCYEGGNIKIGNDVSFNYGCSINSVNGSIIIGNDCLFGEGVKIYDHNHNYKDKGLIRLQGYTSGNVTIGNNCWVGSNSIILKGVTIGSNVVIGAGCIIRNSVESNSVLYSSN